MNDEPSHKANALRTLATIETDVAALPKMSDLIRWAATDADFKAELEKVLDARSEAARIHVRMMSPIVTANLLRRCATEREQLLDIADRLNLFHPTSTAAPLNLKPESIPLSTYAEELEPVRK